MTDDEEDSSRLEVGVWFSNAVAAIPNTENVQAE